MVAYNTVSVANPFLLDLEPHVSKAASWLLRVWYTVKTCKLIDRALNAFLECSFIVEGLLTALNPLLRLVHSPRSRDSGWLAEHTAVVAG